jgi:hypothetical protein
MANVTYSTKRNAVGTNQVTKAVTNIASILGTGLMPIDKEGIDRYRLQSPRQHYLVYFPGTPDILAGDFLTLSSKDYPIRGVSPWPGREVFMECLVEEIK